MSQQPQHIDVFGKVRSGPDTLHLVNVPPDAISHAHYDRITAGMLALAAVLDTLPHGREKSLACTKLEECSMWAKKAVAVAQLQREATKTNPHRERLHDPLTGRPPIEPHPAAPPP